MNMENKKDCSSEQFFCFQQLFYGVSYPLLAVTFLYTKVSTFKGRYVIILPTRKSEVNCVGNKKMGRPTDNPKPHKLSVRLDDAGLRILDDYCAKKQITRMEGIRRGVHRLKDEK